MSFALYVSLKYIPNANSCQKETLNEAAATPTPSEEVKVPVVFNRVFD